MALVNLGHLSSNYQLGIFTAIQLRTNLYQIDADSKKNDTLYCDTTSSMAPHIVTRLAYRAIEMLHKDNDYDIYVSPDIFFNKFIKHSVYDKTDEALGDELTDLLCEEVDMWCEEQTQKWLIDTYKTCKFFKYNKIVSVDKHIDYENIKDKCGCGIVSSINKDIFINAFKRYKKGHPKK